MLIIADIDLKPGSILVPSSALKNIRPMASMVYHQFTARTGPSVLLTFDHMLISFELIEAKNCTTIDFRTITNLSNGRFQWSPPLHMAARTNGQ